MRLESMLGYGFRNSVRSTRKTFGGKRLNFSNLSGNRGKLRISNSLGLLNAGVFCIVSSIYKLLNFRNLRKLFLEKQGRSHY